LFSSIVLIDYYNQHQEIIKFFEKKTAPYIAGHIYFYAKGSEFAKVKKNLKKYIDLYNNHVRRKTTNK